MEQGSLYEAMNNFERLLINDETLLRLLTYEPMGLDENGIFHKDPLDESLNNLVDTDSEDYWELVEDRIKFGEKTSDLEEKSICRIYVYEGRRRPVFNNFLVATQEVNVNIFVHEKFEKDKRIARISDRINQLIVFSREVGMGEIDYVSGNPRVAPTHYRAYYHSYKLNVLKKAGSQRERF